MINKKGILFLVFILLLLISGWLYYSSNIKKSEKFNGTVAGVGDNSFLVHGAYENEIDAVKALYDFSINIDSGTKITKVSFQRPDGGGMFVVDKLPKDTETVGFDTFKADAGNVPLGISVVLKRNMLGAVSNRAMEIKYIGPKY